MNEAQPMNMTTRPRGQTRELHGRQTAETSVFEAVGRALAEQGIEWEVQELQPRPGKAAWDAQARIRKGATELRVQIEIKTHPRIEQVAMLQLRAPVEGYVPMVVAGYIPPPLAHRLKEAGILFADAAGNAFLEGPGLYLWIEGKKDQLRLQAQKEIRRAFQPTGLKILFALLCRPNLINENYRALARETGAALGTVGWVMADLAKEGFVQQTPNNGRRLMDLDRLLTEWVGAYLRVLRPKTLLGKFETEKFQDWKEIDPTNFDAFWGGEPAAAELTGYLRPATLTYWVEKIPARLIARQALRPADEGRVEFRKIFWNQGALDKGMERCAPAVLIYADLLGIADARAVETATRLKKERIDEDWRKYDPRALR